MSFADDQGFKGVIVTDQLDMVESVRLTHALGINPGGEIKAWEIEENEFKRDHLYQLMSKQDLVGHGYIDPDEFTVGDLLKYD